MSQRKKSVKDAVFATRRFLFPNVMAYANFVLMWVFLLVLASNREPIIVLVAALASIYCLNEWTGEMKGNQKGKVRVK